MKKKIDMILSAKSRREVLCCLYRCEDYVTGRELGRRTGFSHQQAHNVLKELIRLGLVERRIFGPAHLFRLVRGGSLEAGVAQVLSAETADGSVKEDL